MDAIVKSVDSALLDKYFDRSTNHLYQNIDLTDIEPLSIKKFYNLSLLCEFQNLKHFLYVNT